MNKQPHSALLPAGLKPQQVGTTEKNHFKKELKFRKKGITSFTNPVNQTDPVPNPVFLQIFLLLQKYSGKEEEKSQ